MDEIEDLPTKPKRRLPGLLLLGAVLSLLAWVAYQWWWGLSHVASDNAQVESHIIPLLPKVGGFVTAVTVVDNQAVRAGDLLAVPDQGKLGARIHASIYGVVTVKSDVILIEA